MDRPREPSDTESSEEFRNPRCETAVSHLRFAAPPLPVKGANGSAAAWNATAETSVVNMKLKQGLLAYDNSLGDDVPRRPDIQTILQWLYMREDRRGRPVLFKFGAPVSRDLLGAGQWWRLEWLKKAALVVADMRTAALAPTDWSRSWHGSHMEAVWAIASDGYLGTGVRTKATNEGVYSHGDSTRRKATGYAPYTSFDGCVWWRCVWELATRKPVSRAKMGRSDQQCNAEQDVALRAIWFEGVRTNDLQLSCLIRPRWIGALECTPRKVNQSRTMTGDVAASIADAVCDVATEIRGGSARPRLPPPPPAPTADVAGSSTDRERSRTPPPPPAAPAEFWAGLQTGAIASELLMLAAL